MITWAVCVYTSSEDLNIGEVYNIVGENELNYKIEINGEEEFYNKKWFITDDKLLFRLILTSAAITGTLETKGLPNLQ